MAKTVKLEDLGAAIQEELTVYHRDVLERVDTLSAQAAKSLVKKTKATAPKGKRNGRYRKSISSKLVRKTDRGSTYAWYVKAPEYRLTHLLVKGHATRDGGRTKANPFLANAVDQVLPQYERDVEEALKNGR